MGDGEPADTATGATFDGGAPDITVVVATHRRRQFLAGLVAALEAQTLGRDRFEVVVVDDASEDGTWDELERIARTTSLRLLARRNAVNRGPAATRNLAAGQGRAPLLAFTDDDCLPAPGWIAGLLDAFGSGGADIVQGRTEGRDEPGHTRRPWDHTIEVSGPTPWFETCNVAYRRDAFDEAKGFDVDHPVLNPGGGKHFGEDVDLAGRVLAAGGRASFAADAVVHHRNQPQAYGDWLAARRRLVDFPFLAQRSQAVADNAYLSVFLDRSTAAFDLAVAGALLAVAKRRTWPVALAAPWLVLRWRLARFWTGGDRAAAIPVAAGLALGDAVALVELARGSARHRKLLL